MITFHINTVQHPCFSPWPRRNRFIFERWSVDFKLFNSHSRAFIVRFFLLLLCRHGVEWDCDVIADVDNGWGECIVLIGSEIYAWNVRFDSCLIFSYFLNNCIFHVIKGIKNGCPCIVEIRGTCALDTSLYSPTARARSSTKAQPCGPPISTMQGKPFLIPRTWITQWFMKE